MGQAFWCYFGEDSSGTPCTYLCRRASQSRIDSAPSAPLAGALPVDGMARTY